MPKPKKPTLLEVGHEMAQGLHQAGIIDDKAMQEFVRLCRTKGPPITITRKIIRIPNDYEIQCECGETLVKALSVETGILDCSCGFSYSVQLHKRRDA